MFHIIIHKQTINNFIVYIIRLVDAIFYGFHTKTDTILEGVQMTGALVEFVFAVLIFFNGLSILLFDAGGLLRFLEFYISENYVLYINHFSQVVDDLCACLL